MKRLLIFTTHPIQYQAPWFRSLAQQPDLSLKVAFSYVPQGAEQGVGFGGAFAWDIPLLEGYPHQVLRTLRTPSFVPAYFRRVVTDLGAAVDAFSPDAVMVLGWQEISLVQALFEASRRGLPVILRGESNGLKPRKAWVKRLHHMLFARCERFLAIGEANAAFYRQSGVSEDRILLAPYCVDNERFARSADELAPIRDELRRNWGIGNATCFAFVGKLEPKKRVLDFLEALGRAHASGALVHGLVVGTGEQMDAARALASRSGVPVTFAGFLNQSQIAKAYVAADMLVLPSDFGETWGLVVNEAAACGAPAIVSDRIGSANDLVLDGQTGAVFPFGDLDRLARSMIEHSSDPQRIARLGAAARDRLNSHYNIEVATAQTLRAIGQAIEERRA